MSLFAFYTATSQESLKEYLIGSNGQNTLKYEWMEEETPNPSLFSIRTVTINSSTVLIKEILMFENKVASETYYSCVLTNNELKTTTIVTNNVINGKSESIVEKILLKLPPVGQTIKWTFTDEKDNTEFSYSVKRTTINNKKALEVTESADGLPGATIHYYLKGVGLYKRSFMNSDGVLKPMMKIVD